ncbi:N-acetylmuramoyl-L-alanine amidase [Candidatus Thioglobus autotrophicus]|uniref:N-acetylmuramoyl-L-alanine amidase family protein n=1 Tax=Candidatus Thioglobus autotrophicus TaxID=1705394 RepID=UPI00299EE06A|nr:N-acetylmuramoyl-L-alanine amidase [Candidatus Thioglobus autotrophicus]WPE16199.1 N-acetylmuramoyl-L-alanine amidase [Candidatus Thioglobus autotrophicus]
MHRLISLLIGLFFLSSAFADNRTTLHDFRFWSSPERTRIVIDVDQGVRFSINQQQNQFTLGIRNAKLLKDTYKKLFFTDQRIKKTRVKRDTTTYQFKFKLHGQYQIKSYTLKPNDKYRHHRLVVDLYDQKNQTTKAVKKPKKPLSKVSVSKQRSTRIILIDAGHGGEDPGAIGYKRSKEKRITLSIAKKLANKINATRGMKAVLTRRGDYYVGLTQRIRIAQANQASLFVSIHADAVKSRRAKGASVYILSERGGSTNFARRLEKSQNTADQFGVKQKLNSKDQYLNKILWDLSRKDRDTQSQKLGTKILQQMQKIGHLHKKKPQKAGFVVLKTPAIPSVLVETAFISNPEEERRLNSNKEQDKIANAIYQGILNYYK